MAKYFPMFVDLYDKKVLVIGAGTIGCRRIQALLQFECQITVVSKNVSLQDERLNIHKRAFKKTDLEGQDIVFAATDDVVLNEQIYEWCREMGIMVNVSSNQKLCDFYFPGTIVIEDTVIGMTSGGRDHGRVKRIRECLEKHKKEWV